MKKSYIWILGAMLFALIECNQNGVTKRVDTEAKFDTSIISIIPFDSEINRLIPTDSGEEWTLKDHHPTSLSSHEVNISEKLLVECIVNANKETREFIEKKHPERSRYMDGYIIRLDKYKRQYVPAINSKGEKEIWINCACGERGKSWKKNIIFVFDGGNCYFNLKVNLTTGKYYDFSVNGSA